MFVRFLISKHIDRIFENHVFVTRCFTSESSVGATNPFLEVLLAFLFFYLFFLLKIVKVQPRKSLQMRICLKSLRVKLKKSLQMSICLQILRVSYLQSFCNLPSWFSWIGSILVCLVMPAIRSNSVPSESGALHVL